LLLGVLENYHKVEQDLFAFLGSLEGKSTDEIADMPLPDFINLLTELFGEKNLPFFKSLVK
ncbi:MAG: hypothetical protein PHH26_03320, partial [Candidatus Thermoplasmatota archaeon]|nr:hypothetical protein [Candidatus Thermoplasmatota archaeon]